MRRMVFWGVIASVVLFVVLGIYLFMHVSPAGSPFFVSGQYVEKDGKTPREKVIVFVHGVTGDGNTTWRNAGNGNEKRASWPELMRQDRNLSEYDVFTISYTSPLFGKADSIVELASKLNKVLSDNKILPSIDGKDGKDSKVKEIFFLGHSMGNLIIRTALMIEKAYNSNSVNVPLILSIASPSNGSRIAQVARYFSSNPQYKAMAGIEGNQFLQLLNFYWKNNAPLDIEIACAYETKPIEQNLIVVDKESAIAVCTRQNVKEIQENHISIVKPRDYQSPIYRWAFDQLSAPRKHKYDSHPARWDEKTIIIGGKDFLESNILVAMMAFVINPHFREGCKTDEPTRGNCINVERAYHIGGRDRVFEELANGEIDIYPEYTGTILANFPDLSFEESRNPKNHSTEYINKLFEDRRDWRRFEFLLPFGFENSYQLIIRRKKAEEVGMSTQPGQATISDLAEIALKGHIKLKFESTPDFFYRRDGIPGLREKYKKLDKKSDKKFDFTSIDYTLHENKYADLANDSVDVVDGYTTDPELLDEKSTFFIKLRDDKHFFPPYFASAMANKQLLDTFSHIRDSLSKLHMKISAKDMSSLISQAASFHLRSEELGNSSEAQQKLEEIVKKYLIEKGILDRRE